MEYAVGDTARETGREVRGNWEFLPTSLEFSGRR